MDDETKGAEPVADTPPEANVEAPEGKSSGGADTSVVPMDIEQVAHLKLEQHLQGRLGDGRVRVVLVAEGKDGSNFGTCLRSVESQGLGDGYVGSGTLHSLCSCGCRCPVSCANWCCRGGLSCGGSLRRQCVRAWIRCVRA
jgi:hypothetical protein